MEQSNLHSLGFDIHAVFAAELTFFRNAISFQNSKINLYYYQNQNFSKQNCVFIYTSACKQHSLCN